MKKYLTSMLVIGSLLFLGGIVYAEDSTSVNTNSDASINTTNTMKPIFKTKQRPEQPKIQQRSEETVKVRQQLQNDVKNIRTELQNKLMLNREEVKNKAEAKRAELKTKLQVIKNEKKQKIVLNISDKITEMNVKATDRLSILLGNIDKILAVIKDKTDQISTNNDKDTTTVKTKISAATDLIVKAKADIEAQAGKTYTINVTDESTLRANVKATRDEFQSDIKSVQASVKDAHEAVRASAQALAEIYTPNVTASTQTEADVNTSVEN